jgi:hypothetical protein
VAPANPLWIDRGRASGRLLLRGYDSSVAHDISIDWSSAEVTAGTGSLELRVRLSDEPDTTWRNAFEPVRQEAKIEGETESGRFYVNAVSGYGNDLSAGGFAPGAEDEVRRLLDDLVARTNKRAELDAKASAERKESTREAAEKLEHDAEDATTRFRSES